jgi:hypothetical protein
MLASTQLVLHRAAGLVSFERAVSIAEAKAAAIQEASHSQ